MEMAGMRVAYIPLYCMLKRAGNEGSRHVASCLDCGIVSKSKKCLEARVDRLYQLWIALNCASTRASAAYA